MSNARPIYLKLPWVFQFRFAGYVAALEKGFYREHGLNVTLLTGLPGSDVVDEVVAGRAQFGVAGTALLAHRAYGQPVVMLAPMLQNSPHVLLTLAKSDIDHPSDLAGKRLMLADGFGSAEVWAMLRSAEVLDEDVIVADPTWRVSALTTGRVDAMDALISDHPLQLQRMGVAYDLLRPRDYGIDFYGDLLFTSEGFLARHPETVAAFREATLRGWDYALAHPEEIIALLLDKYQSAGNGYDREFLLQEARALQPLVRGEAPSLGHSDPVRWQEIVQTYVDLGFVPQNIDLGSFFYLSPTRFDHWSRWATRFGAAAGGIALVVLAVWAMGRKSWRRKEEVEEDLRLALKRGELVIHYQPLVDLVTGRTIGMEALLRWQHPRRGLLSPAEFLPLAEKSGLVIPIGQWMLGEACRQMVAWQEKAGHPLRLALNLSPRQFFSAGLVPTLRRIARETGFCTGQLQLEIGEKVIQNDEKRAVQVMQALAELGVDLVVDDFGGDPVSLQCFGRVPVSVVKIDPNRVLSNGACDHPDAAAQALMASAATLGIGIAAKGIETPDQLESLKRGGCRLGQGFLLGRPEREPIQIDFVLGFA